MAAMPLVARYSTMASDLGGKTSGTASSSLVEHAAISTSGEDLILVVRGDKVTGYRGLEEMPIHDSSFASSLRGRFPARGQI